MISFVRFSSLTESIDGRIEWFRVIKQDLPLSDIQWLFNHPDVCFERAFSTLVFRVYIVFIRMSIVHWYVRNNRPSLIAVNVYESVCNFTPLKVWDSNMTHRNSYRNISTVWIRLFLKIIENVFFICIKDCYITISTLFAKMFKEDRDGVASSWKQRKKIFYIIAWLDGILLKWTMTSNFATLFL